jgi:hypothetical protein
MLLATIIGKIMSFYRSASQSYFGQNYNQSTRGGNGISLPLTFGSYRVASEDGRWLEMEILWRELRKLEELFARFREMCTGEVQDGGGGKLINEAMTTYLAQNLHFTFEVLKMHEGAIGVGDG